MRTILSGLKFKCQFDGCDEIATYGNVKRHNRNCEKNLDTRIQTCEFCKKKTVRKNLESHRKNCNEFIKYQISHLEIRKNNFNQEFEKAKDKEQERIKYYTIV